jgi:hypothetical protein
MRRVEIVGIHYEHDLLASDMNARARRNPWKAYVYFRCTITCDEPLGEFANSSMYCCEVALGNGATQRLTWAGGVW